MTTQTLRQLLATTGCAAGILLAASIGPAPIAHAATVTVNFGGSVKFVSPELASFFSIGESAAFELIYDSTEIDINPQVDTGAFPFISMSGSMGAHSASGSAGFVTMRNKGAVNTAGDDFNFTQSVFTASGPTLPGVTFRNLHGQMRDASGLAFATADQLPTAFPNPSVFGDEPNEPTELQFRFQNSQGFLAAVSADIATISVQVDGLTPVPVPAALPLLLVGLAGLGGFRFIGRRRARR